MIVIIFGGILTIGFIFTAFQVHNSNNQTGDDQTNGNQTKSKGKNVFITICIVIATLSLAVVGGFIYDWIKSLVTNNSNLDTSIDELDSGFYFADPIINTSTTICLTNLERVKFECYNGNLGDSRLNVLGYPYEYGYGNVGVNGEVFKDGFEGWVARWNPLPEQSWVFVIYDLDCKYKSISVSTGLIQSYNTTDFNTTLYFYGDNDALLHSQILTNEEYKYNFNVDVTGVKHLKIMLKDNIAVKGGTSFALYNLYLT